LPTALVAGLLMIGAPASVRTSIRQLSEDSSSDITDHVLSSAAAGDRGGVSSGVPAARHSAAVVGSPAGSYRSMGGSSLGCVPSEDAPLLLREGTGEGDRASHASLTPVSPCSSVTSPGSAPAAAESAFEVELRRARGLLGADRTVTSDPYLRVSYAGVALESSVCEATVDPVWAGGEHGERLRLALPERLLAAGGFPSPTPADRLAGDGGGGGGGPLRGAVSGLDTRSHVRRRITAAAPSGLMIRLAARPALISLWCCVLEVSVDWLH
jgi:hypothetical protein